MPDTTPTQARNGEAVKGCGCLLVILLVIVGMISSCLGGDDETDAPSTLTRDISATPTTARPPAVPIPTRTPAPTSTTTPAPSPAPDPEPDPDPDRRLVPDPEPARRPAPAPAPEPEPASGGGSAYYKNCDAVQAAGAAPIRRGDPGYARHLDRDGDGEGCAGD